MTKIIQNCSIINKIYIIYKIAHPPKNTTLNVTICLLLSQKGKTEMGVKDEYVRIKEVLYVG